MSYRATITLSAKLAATTLAAAILACAAAQADIVEEARIGVTEHNICVLNLDCDNADKEGGPNISGELVFGSPDFLRFALAPRPYIVISGNMAGKTNFGGAGLHWNWGFADGWALEPGFGYALIDGSNANPFPQGDPRGDAFTEKNILIGSKDLLRTSLSLNRDFGENWGGQIMYEHLSHGQIVGNGRNQGLDNLGVRIYYKLGQ